VTYDSERVAAFFDEYGEREWTRFEDGRTPATSLVTHTHYLEKFIRPGDRVLDVGAGPGRFTLELARLGAEIVVADVSAGQLELNERRLLEAGLEERVHERVVADVTDLTDFADGRFDATVCYGGPVSYAVDRADRAVSELVRVTRVQGHVLLSVMSLVGALARYIELALDLVRRDGVGPMEGTVRTGVLPEGDGYGHLEMKLFRWSELERLLSGHGTIVAASAAGLLAAHPDEPELRELLARVELDVGAEPGAISCGEHILAVVRRDA
jgi:ubiquinone/menaquinone biosynthesis C-methylase UbiE